MVLCVAVRDMLRKRGEAAAICSRICGSAIVPSGPMASRVTGMRLHAASTMSAWT
jgi:hypothetical protein